MLYSDTIKRSPPASTYSIVYVVYGTTNSRTRHLNASLYTLRTRHSVERFAHIHAASTPSLTLPNIFDTSTPSLAVSAVTLPRKMETVVDVDWRSLRPPGKGVTKMAL